MNRLCAVFTRYYSRVSATTPSTSYISPLVFSPRSSLDIPSPKKHEYIPPPLPIALPTNNIPIDLPGFDGYRKVYMFPTLNRQPLVEPPSEIPNIEKVEPTVQRELVLPALESQNVMICAPRLLTIRRKKMKKHKRRKRFNRDWALYQKYHREKKLKAEREYLKRMNARLEELRAFDPEKYVEETIAASKKVWEKELAPSGRKLYPHWSRFMSLEELYGLEKSDYIDKKACLPTEEDKMKIAQLKEKYEKEFRGITKSEK